MSGVVLFRTGKPDTVTVSGHIPQCANSRSSNTNTAAQRMTRVGILIPINTPNYLGDPNRRARLVHVVKVPLVGRARHPHDTIPDLFQYVTPRSVGVSNPRRHSGSHSKRTMSTHKVIVPEMQSNRRLKAFKFFREGVGQPSESPDMGSHCKVLSLNVGSADFVMNRLAENHFDNSFPQDSWAIPFGLTVGFVALVYLANHGIVDICAKDAINGVIVTGELIGAKLEAGSYAAA